MKGFNMNQDNKTQVTTPQNNTNQAIGVEAHPEATVTPNAAINTPPVAETPAQPVEKNQPKIQDEVIYKIKEEKGGNLIGVILFFAIMFAALYFLPTINENIGKFIPGISNNGTISNPPVSEKEEKETDKEEKEELLDLTGYVSNAVIDNLQLGNFVKDKNTGINRLAFYILNNDDDVFTFNDNTMFYIDLYENDRYLSSALVYSYKDIGPKESVDFSVVLPLETYNKANKFKLVRKNKSEYPPVTLSIQEGEYKKLSCSFNNSVVDYYFIDNYLEIINDSYSESKTAINYAQDLENYRNESTKYTSIPSMDYNIIETNEGFSVKTRIDLQDINDSDLKKLAIYKYFSYHKEAKVVSFEMKALGYNCS